LVAVTHLPLEVAAVAVRVLLVHRLLVQWLVLAGLEQHQQFLVQALLMAAVVVVEVELHQQVVWVELVAAAMVQ
jgi:hypothetical protein